MLFTIGTEAHAIGRTLARALTALALVSVLPLISSAQPSPGVFGPGPGCNLFPAPASVGATVGLSYFGPPPSTGNPNLVGPVQLLKSGQVDDKKGTVTLPLYRGSMSGSNKAVWYIVTDASDPEIASLLGLNFSAKLGFAINGSRTAAYGADGSVVFDRGTVDFTPVRKVTPGALSTPFPPSFAQKAKGSKKSDKMKPDQMTDKMTNDKMKSEKTPDKTGGDEMKNDKVPDEKMKP